jgi:LPXTG-motif cell wall-anchored protein
MIGGYIKDATGTFTYAFLLSAAVSLAGGAGSLVLRKRS